MSLYYVITDFVQGFHQLVEINTHLFYDFQTKKIEAIGREWNSAHRKGMKKYLSSNYVLLDSTYNKSILHSKIFWCALKTARQ